MLMSKRSGDQLSRKTLEERLRRIDADQLQVQVAAAERRRALGRYTLDEAADVLNRETGAGRACILMKLILAVESGELPTYEPELNTRKLYEGPGDVCSFYEEVYWEDINKWLSTNEPRLSYEFSVPATPEQLKQPAGDRTYITKAVPRQQAQEETILTTLRDLGFDPQHLPVPSRFGKRSPAKHAVRSKLDFTHNVFNKAWQRLRGDGRIKDASS